MVYNVNNFCKFTLSVDCRILCKKRKMIDFCELHEAINTHQVLLLLHDLDNKRKYKRNMCLFHYLISHIWQLQRKSTRGNQHTIYYLILYI